jgi:hypothetical protein
VSITSEYQVGTVVDASVDGEVHTAIPAPLHTLNPTVCHSVFAQTVDREAEKSGYPRIWMVDLMLLPLPADRAGFGTSVKFAFSRNYSAFCEAFAQHWIESQKKENKTL